MSWFRGSEAARPGQPSQRSLCADERSSYLGRACPSDAPRDVASISAVLGTGVSLRARPTRHAVTRMRERERDATRAPRYAMRGGGRPWNA